jgi:hypothetical protein
MKCGKFLPLIFSSITQSTMDQTLMIMSQYFLSIMVNIFITSLIYLILYIINIIWGFDIFGGVRGLTFY